VLVDCDDGDACTEDLCEPALGCNNRKLTLDSDGDGYLGPRPGSTPGTPEACGDDCDDSSASVFPGNRELCDGLDNDCNGIKDDGVSEYVPLLAERRLSGASDVRSSVGGLTATSSQFVVSYSARRGTRRQNLLALLDPNLQTVTETQITQLNTDAFAGPVIFSGSTLTAAWEDARQEGNYEIYLATFDASGNKLAPDLRVTDAPNFSLNPELVLNGSEYLLVWDDRRAEGTSSFDDLARVYGRRIGLDGTPLGPDRLLTADEPLAESPDVAVGANRIGLVFVSSDGVPRVVFRALDPNLQVVGERPSPIGEFAQAPSVHWVADRFVVLFNTYEDGPGPGLWGAVFSAQGSLLVPPRQLNAGARFARTHDALSLGDRLLVVWADDFDGNYELYSQVVDPALLPLQSRRRLTTHPGDTLGPAIAPGPNGLLGVAFSDTREGSMQAYVMALGCP
jgi:hypothetical protein